MSLNPEFRGRRAWVCPNDDGSGTQNRSVRLRRRGNVPLAAEHVDDAAALYFAAAEQLADGRLSPGVPLHAVGDEGVATPDLATAIGDQVGVPVGQREREHFGWFKLFIDRDSPTSSDKTRSMVGRNPTGPSLLDDIRSDAYAAAEPLEALKIN